MTRKISTQFIKRIYAKMSIPVIAINICSKSNTKHVGASVYQRLNRKHEDDENYCLIQLYEFEDNESFSASDAFLTQIGACTLYLSDEHDDLHNQTSATTSHNIKKARDNKKLLNIFHGKDIELIFVKPSFLIRAPVNNSNTIDLAAKILKLTGKPSHVTNSAEVEMPIAYGTICWFFSSYKICHLHVRRNS